MKALELKEKIKNGALSQYAGIYKSPEMQKERFIRAIDAFCELYGDREAVLLSVPGRSEISGNHTDHNMGIVLAGAIDRDVIAVAAKSDEAAVRLYSEGYGESVTELNKVNDKESFEKYSSAALIAGTLNGFTKRGYNIGGFDAYLTSDVLKGSGISSSAAYEVMLGNILNHLYNGGNIDNKEIAKIAKYSENEYFGKPCGLMDQMACAVGGFVYIDFENEENPSVVPIDFSLSSLGYSLAIINTGGNHADLNEDYASVPREMHAVASLLGCKCLRSSSEESLIGNIGKIRSSLGDRAVLRALHFFRENERVEKIRDALTSGNLSVFLDTVRESGSSSFKYLQNVYTNTNVREQGLSLALAIADKFVGRDGASRVHGGGFAGTVQVFLKEERVGELSSLMNSIFGENATMILNVRPLGAVRLF